MRSNPIACWAENRFLHNPFVQKVCCLSVFALMCLLPGPPPKQLA